MALLATIPEKKWNKRYTYPRPTCKQKMFTRCAPDLDGDSVNDFVVKLAGIIPIDNAATSGDCSKAQEHGWPSSVLYLVSGTKMDRLLGVVHHNVDNGQGGPIGDITGFLKVPEKGVGIRLDTTSVGSDDGCVYPATEVFAIKGGKLTRVYEKRDKRQCQ